MWRGAQVRSIPRESKGQQSAFHFYFILLVSPTPWDKVAWAGLELRIYLLHLLNARIPGVDHHTQLKYLFVWTKWTLICFFWIASHIMKWHGEDTLNCEQTLEKPEVLLTEEEWVSQPSCWFWLLFPTISFSLGFLPEQCDPQNSQLLPDTFAEGCWKTRIVFHLFLMELAYKHDGDRSTARFGRDNA